jgi:hypothetical protein
MNVVLADANSSSVLWAAFVVMVVIIGLGIWYIWWSDRPNDSA